METRKSEIESRILIVKQGLARIAIATYFYSSMKNMEKHSLNKGLISFDTSSAILRELANSDDESTRCQVAQHPNTPPDVLKQLFRYYPVAILTNPIIKLLLLENPNFLEELCDSLSLKDFIFNLIPYTLPLFFLEWGLNNNREDIHLKFICITHISVELLNILHLDTDSSIIGNIATNENTPVEILEELSRYPDFFVRSQVARNKKISAKIIEQLSLDEDKKIRCQIAKNQNTPQSILEQLSLDRDFSVRSAVASNQNIPAKILEQLSLDKYYPVIYEVARNQNTPQSVLEQLSLDRDFSVRSAVASNQNIPVKILEQLSLDPHKDVRVEVARNQNTPQSILEKLSLDENYSVRSHSHQSLHGKNM